MRDFNAKEHELYEKMRTRDRARMLFNPKVQYDVKGNFTVAIVQSRGKLLTGVAKRNPSDPAFVEAVGKTIALTRAISK
jgi:hypothetical protein